jgi:hypothetical protein
VNPFTGQPQAQLEIWLAEAQRQLAEGTTPQSILAGDFSSTDFVQGNPEDRIAKLLEALNRLDPLTYPAADTRRVTRTRVRVSNSDPAWPQ